MKQMLHHFIIHPESSYYAMALLCVGACLAALIMWRDWEFFEIDDREIIGLGLLGLFWSWLGVHHVVSALCAAVVVTLPAVLSWWFTRKDRHPLAAEGDIMLSFTAGLWSGLSGICFVMIGVVFFGLLLSLIGSPRVYWARQREAETGDPDWKGRFRPTRYLAYPMAPALLSSVAVWIVLSFCF